MGGFATQFFGFTGAESGSSSEISGTIASPQVAYATAANTIGGDATFTFSAAGKKEVTANLFQINANKSGILKALDGSFEYDGAQVYFTIGATTYKVSLTT